VYNGALRLEECLDSVLGQSHSHLQVIVIDDGSTDSTPDILARRAAADRRLEVVRQEQSGVSAARNVGIARMKGDYVAFVDADDALHPYALETLLRAILRSKAQVAVAPFITVSDMPPPASKPARTKVKLMGGETAIVRCLLQTELDTAVWGKLYHAAIFDSKLRFRPGRFEDLDIIYRIYDRAHRVCLLSVPLYYYRDNPEGFMHDVHSDSRFDSLEVCDRMLEYTQLYSSRVKGAVNVRTMAAAYNALGIIYAHGLERNEVEERCYHSLRYCRSRAFSARHLRRRDRLGTLLAYMPRFVIKMVIKALSGRYARTTAAVK